MNKTNKNKKQPKYHQQRRKKKCTYRRKRLKWISGGAEIMADPNKAVLEMHSRFERYYYASNGYLEGRIKGPIYLKYISDSGGRGTLLSDINLMFYLYMSHTRDMSEQQRLRFANDIKYIIDAYLLKVITSDPERTRAIYTKYIVNSSFMEPEPRTMAPPPRTTRADFDVEF